MEVDKREDRPSGAGGVKESLPVCCRGGVVNAVSPRMVGCPLFTSAFSSIWPGVERVLQTPIGLSAYRTKKEIGRLVLDSGIRGSVH